MKKNTFDFIAYAVFIFIIGFLIYLAFFLGHEARQCLKNPYIYGADKMGNVSCYCLQAKQNPFCPAIFTFNGTAFSPHENKCGSNGQAIDLNKLDITK